MNNLTGSGQIKAGATIALFHKNEAQVHTVDEVLFSGADTEEILLDKKTNLYFIVSMAINGRSWAKDVKFENKALNTTSQTEGK